MTTSDAIDFLTKYWRAANGGDDLGRLTYEDAINAREAIDDLAYHAQGDAEVRRAFAQAGIFESAITIETTGKTDELLAQLMASDACRNKSSWARPKICNPTPPRLAMLKRIWDAGAGEALFVFDRVSVTEWLHTALVSGTMMHITITNDPNPDVRALALKIVSDLAIPVEWLHEFKLQRTFETINEQLPHSDWNANIRGTLQGLAAKAAAHVDAELARTQLAQAGGLPGLTKTLAAAGFTAPPTGNGQAALTTPKPPVIWYRNPKLLSAGALGVLGGMLAAHGNRLRLRPQRR